MGSRRILIDTDPGVDDAMAILFALRSPELEVVGLTTVFGNAEVATVTQNALRLVELEGHDAIPVAPGADAPLVVPRGPLGTFVHGQDGFGNTDPPPPRGRPLAMPGARFIVETVAAHPGEITLVAIGPLTNLALALHLEPRLPEWVAQVVVMGGAARVPGNVTPVAEANIINDPHAARLVFAADWPLVMVGLDVTTRVVMTRDYLERLGQVGNPATDQLRRILPCYQAFHRRQYGMDGDIHTHDPSAIAYLLAPELFRTEEVGVWVETEGRCRGQTVVDPQGRWPDCRPVHVCVDVEVDGVLALYWERLAGSAPAP